MALGARIKQARMLRGLNQRELAAKIDRSKTTVSKYEREITLPDSAKLMDIAEALDIDLSYFLRNPRVGDIEPAYRKFSSMLVKEENAIVERIRDWLERYLEVESILEIDALDFEWPEEVPYRVSSIEEIEQAALHLRDAWEIGRDPIENLTERLEDHALRVGSIEAPDDFDACAFEAQVDGGIPVIVFNEKYPGDRQRFSIAHELGHLVLKVGGELKEEQACDRFSGAFLVPRYVFVNDVGEERRRISQRELELLKQKYGMSMQALVYRMKDLSILSDHHAGQIFRWFRETGNYKEEPGEPVSREQPQRFERMVQHALAEEYITDRRAAELLDRDADDLPEPVLA
ncbi:helix-turn-helix domain-containing protein [Salinibacter ruber]|jgi:Zn-dependent peptidase ImmA (M78 family)/DNA-binding XRE family transcriptional regulator|uniref:helix-turn-helix domain-containing protein n=1 Tax=Salinibacter ruber TaxID=146919 RepID=UPI00207425A3|nr:XRE family transcriptional regulator [Salinibacter ruber]